MIFLELKTQVLTRLEVEWFKQQWAVNISQLITLIMFNSGCNAKIIPQLTHAFPFIILQISDKPDADRRQEANELGLNSLESTAKGTFVHSLN